MNKALFAILLSLIMLTVPNTEAQAAKGLRALGVAVKAAKTVDTIKKLSDHPDIIALPHISPPISVTFRRSLVGRGLVMRITNNSISSIYDITVATPYTRSNPRLGKQAIVESLAAGASVEVGWMQVKGGFEPGDEFQVGAKHCVNDYAGTVPKP